MTFRQRQTIATLTWILLAQAANAQTDQEIVVPLSDPSRPAVLEVSAMRGSVAVTGYDGDQILIVLDEGPQRIEPEPANGSRQGLQRITNTSMGLSAEELDNTVSVRLNSGEDDAGINISVPRRTSVRARAIRDGSVVVTDVVGEHELSNMNGDIRATDLSGSVVVNTNNGDVTVSMLELTPDTAMSFTTFNGDVEVALPANLAADLHITTNRGEVFTDFDVDIQPQAPIVERSEDGGRFQVRLEREIRATVGGGGPEMRFKTFNGDVVIRSR